MCISGWLCSRRYYDRGVKRMRRIMEVNAQKISYGRGCDFERGERQRISILAELKAGQAPIPVDLASEAFVLHPKDALADLA